MFISDISKLSQDSNTYVNVQCDKKCCEKCENIKEEKYKTSLESIHSNKGVFICNECLFHLNTNNLENYFDENYFNKIDNTKKAYLLGLIINNIKKYDNIKNEYIIELYNQNKKIINLIYYISNDILINNEVLLFTIKSKTIINDINKHFNIANVLDNTINTNFDYFLNIINNTEIQLAFIRAYIEKNLSLNINEENIECSISGYSNSSYSKDNISIINKILNIPSNIKNVFNIIYLNYNDANIIDIFGKIYINNDGLILDELYNKYINILNKSTDLPLCKILKTDINAIIPSKTRESDVGYDLTIIKEVKKFNSKTILYDTGIKLYIKQGYYVEIVPRSSISKSGYILANSIGIIDQSYRGNLMVALTKIDDTADDLVLPFKCCQLIFRKQLFVNMIEVIDSFEETNRNEGGYGSTSS